MYLEKLILEPHHVEIQVFGDGRGRAIHLGERECSIQRRHQKVWEESPAPILEQFPKTRESMFSAAIRIAENVNYAGAGTLEFIVDGSGNFYFLEMNTRLQVEHPVTEWVTGVDLVGWQLLLAAGELKLPNIPERKGSAIEVRLYAEDPQTFLPAPGQLGLIDMPTGAFVRTDSAFREPGEVSLSYDPMIAKISVWAPTRAEAVERMRVALDETRVMAPLDRAGVKKGSLRTNLSFLRRLARNLDVIEGNTTTDLIARNETLTRDCSQEISLSAALATAIHQMLRDSGAISEETQLALKRSSIWSQSALIEGLRK
jgi:acetyl-CoA carboxylase, biotin carboxylase subunit